MSWIRKIFDVKGGDKKIPSESEDVTITSKWIGWLRRENDLVMEYTLTGALPNEQQNVIQFNVTIVRDGSQIYKLTNIFLKPSLGYPECYLLMMLQSTTSDESTGFIPIRTTPTPGGVTLMNVVERDDSEKVFHMLCLGKEMAFVIRNKQEDIVRLPLHNDAGFLSLYIEISDSLLPRTIAAV